MDYAEASWRAFAFVAIPTILLVAALLWVFERRRPKLVIPVISEPDSEIDRTSGTSSKEIERVMESLLPDEISSDPTMTQIYETVEQIKSAFENPSEIADDPEIDAEMSSRQISWLDASTTIEYTTSDLRTGIKNIGESSKGVNELVLGDFSGMLVQAVSDQNLTDAEAKYEIDEISKKVTEYSSRIATDSEKCRGLVIELVAQLRILGTTPNSPAVRSRVEPIRELSKSIKGLELTGTLSALLGVIKVNTFSDPLGDSFSEFDECIRGIVPWSQRMIDSCESFLERVDK